MDPKNKLSDINTLRSLDQYLQELLDEACREDFAGQFEDPTKYTADQKQNLLHYVQNMQTALMPYSELLQELFSESFLYSVRKEEVSGDFYWIEQCNDKIYIAVADSQEQGVAGAFMSIICASALNRVMHEFNIEDTGKMLDKTRELMMETYKNPFGKEFGINISLCCINKHTCVLEWSGANNNLFYVHHGIMEEMSGNKKTVGNHDCPLPFTTHKMYLSKGDMIYLFTDGFAKQEGGENGERLMNKRFQDMLIKVAPLGAESQKEILQKKFGAWKEGYELTDDVLLIGLRL